MENRNYPPCETCWASPEQLQKGGLSTRVDKFTRVPHDRGWGTRDGGGRERSWDWDLGCKSQRRRGFQCRVRWQRPLVLQEKQLNGRRKRKSGGKGGEKLKIKSGVKKRKEHFRKSTDEISGVRGWGSASALHGKGLSPTCPRAGAGCSALSPARPRLSRPSPVRSFCCLYFVATFLSWKEEMAGALQAEARGSALPHQLIPLSLPSPLRAPPGPAVEEKPRCEARGAGLAGP